MKASIRTLKNGTVVAVLDAEAAQVTFACVIFAARIHEEIVPLARIVEQQLQIEGAGTLDGEVSYAGDSSRTR
ncbi:MAG: hypothetical protein ACRD3N_15780 [Terracidiphilus sp.]